ncbi:hypothetical protein JXM67_12175 [candidate division WOR-3 bacterium]|nr:hypothetical protein [candidate division WOR-3 bacterium]
MASSDKESTPKERNRGLVVLTWILVAALALSVILNVILVVSLGGLKKSVQDMRDPVNLYYGEKLEELESDLAMFEAITTTVKGKSPYAGDIKKLRKDLDKTCQLWKKASQVTGTRWFLIFNKALGSQERVEKAWQELRTKAGY